MTQIKHKETESWWTNDDGTSWPPFLLKIITTSALRTRLRERAAEIVEPSLVASALEIEHRANPIVTIGLLKQAFERIGSDDYDFSAAREAQTSVCAAGAIAPKSKSGKVLPFPNCSKAPLTAQRSASVTASLEALERKLQDAIKAQAIPAGVDANRNLIRAMLHIRRRPAPAALDEAQVQE